MNQRPVKVEAAGAVTDDTIIAAINEAAALRDDLPEGFFKLSVSERLQILGLTGQKERN